MSRVIVVGAGGFGRELAAWVRHEADFLAGRSLLFVDDDPTALDRYPALKPSLIGPLRSFAPEPGDSLLLGVGSPATKSKLDGVAAERGLEWSNFAHHSAVIADDSNLGPGSIVCPQAVVGPGVTLGRLVTLNLCTTVGHDAQIGDYSSLMSHADVTGWVTLGKGSYLGSHASVLPGLTVGAGAVLGAGSVSVKDVPEGVTVVGVPARALKHDGD